MYYLIYIIQYFALSVCIHSDWSKSHVSSEYKKACFIVLAHVKCVIIIKQMKKPTPSIIL